MNIKRNKANVTEKQYVSQTELSQISGMSTAFYEKDRSLYKGKSPGIPYAKFGRAVRYELSEALAALEARGARSASELLSIKEETLQLSAKQAQTEF